MDYKEFIDSVFDNFIVNDIYEEHYKKTMEDCESEYQRLIENGVSELDANLRIIEKYKVLKARLGFRLDRKKVEKSKVEMEFKHTELGKRISKIADVLFYIIVAFALFFAADVYGIIVSVLFALPALFLVNIFVIKSDLYLLLRYQIVSVFLLSSIYLIGIIAGGLSYEFSAIIVILVFALVNALLCYFKLKVYDSVQFNVYQSWSILAALDLSVILFYYLIGRIVLDGFIF